LTLDLPKHWGSPDFVHANTVITLAWALAFVVLVGADIVMLYAPEIPPRFGVIATVLVFRPRR
jgi:hypothetical protein